MGSDPERRTRQSGGKEEAVVTPRTFKRTAARQDLIDHYVDLAGVAGEAVADRFLVRAEQSFAELAAQPEMGAPLALRRPDLVELRKWRVRDFEDVLIFYRPRPDGVSIVRVLHGAIDWWRLLGLV